jgi:hypothetical protein
LTKGKQRRVESLQNTAAFPQPLSCACRASTYMTCSSVYALPCFGFELVNSMCSHPAAHAPAAKTAAFFHARDLFARASTVLLLMSVRVAGTADRLAETGRQSRPRRERPKGMGAGPASLSFPTGRPGAGSLRTPLALGRRSGVSAKTSREGVF